MRVFSLILLTIFLVSSWSAQAKKCDYEFRGKVRVKHNDHVRNLIGKSSSPLKNIVVRVSARAKVGFGWGWWKKWADLRTDENGEFNYKIRRKCHKRRFKVKVRFKHPRLEVRHAKSTRPGRKKVKWYLAYREDSGHSGRNDYSEYFNLTVGDGGPRQLDDREPHYHADIWTLYWDAIDYFDGLENGRFRFQDKIKVKYPHEKKNLDSYANPLNNVIYLVKKSDDDDDGQDVDTIIHELMHIWAYQHSRKENRMAWYLIGHMQRGTHGHVDKTFVAFHEGFAEFAKDKVLESLYGRWNAPPFSSNFLTGDDVNLDRWGQVEFHDLGWWNIFKMLTFNDLWEFDFDTSNNFLGRTHSGNPAGWIRCSSPRALSFVDILDLIERPGRKDIHARNMNWNDFMNEVQRQRRGFSREDRQSLRVALDPQSSDDDVNGAFCTPFRRIPVPIPRPIPIQP